MPAPINSAWTSATGRFALGVLFATLAAYGCDIPTDIPIIESRWIVPAEETRFGVDELLPGEVSISPDSTTFIVDFDSVAFASSLADLCTLCAAAHGFTVPKPPFSGTVESSVDFPSEVYQVTVVSGQVVLEVENLLGFDPIRPSADSIGTITLRVTDTADGDVLAELVLSGATTAFPSGTTLSRNLALAASEVNGGLLASVILDSPLGDPVTVDTTAMLDIVATPSNVRVSDVSIDVSGEAVTFDPVDLDVDVGDDLIQDITGGAFILNVTNPFGVAADFDLTIDGPTMPAPIVRNDSISTDPESTVIMTFTAEELQSFLGEPGVVLTGGATVSATAGIVSVSPGEELILDADFDVTFRIDGESN